MNIQLMFHIGWRESKYAPQLLLNSYLFRVTLKDRTEFAPNFDFPDDFVGQGVYKNLNSSPAKVTVAVLELCHSIDLTPG